MKDNFELLNNVDMDLDKYEDLKIDKDKLKKKMREQIKVKSNLKRNIVKVASICIVGGGLVVAGIMNPSLANKIPVIENIFEDLNDKFSLGYRDPSEIQLIGESRKYNGVSLSIEQALSDGYSISLTYVIKSDKKLPRDNDYKPYGEQSGDFYFYGEHELNNEDLEIASYQNLGGYFKDEYTFVGIIRYDLYHQNKDIPKYIDFDLDINGIGHPDKDVIMNGKWKFSLKINTNESIKNIKSSAKSNNFNISNVGISNQNLIIDIEVLKSNEDFTAANLGKYIEIYLDNTLIGVSYCYKISESNGNSTYRVVSTLYYSPNEEEANILDIKFKNNDEFNISLDN